MKCAAVEPVPRPTTIPSSISSRAASAAWRLSSSNISLVQVFHDAEEIVFILDVEMVAAFVELFKIAHGVRDHERMRGGGADGEERRIGMRFLGDGTGPVAGYVDPDIRPFGQFVRIDQQ